MQFHITIIIFKFKIIENMISGKQWHIFSPLSTVGLQKDYKNARIPWSSSCRLQRAWRRSIKTTWNRHQNMSRVNAIHRPSSIHAKDTEKVKIDIFTGSARYGRNMPQTHLHHNTFEKQTSTNDKWNQNSDENKWTSNATHRGIRRNNISLLTFPDRNHQIRSNDRATTISG